MGPKAERGAEERRLSPSVTPRGRLVAVRSAEAPALDAGLAERLGEAFGRAGGEGLLHLAGSEVETALPPAWAFFRELGGRYLTAVCTRPELEGAALEVPRPARAELDALAASAPPMGGGEYLTGEVLGGLWGELDRAFRAGLEASGLPLQGFLKSLAPAWNLVGRVHFNLALNSKDEAAPFAFLATYTSRLSATGKAQHLPLGQALQESARADRREQLLSLLLPVQRAAERLPWLRRMVDGGEIFHPLRWSAREAFRLLSDLPELELAGVVVRMPAGWAGGRPPRPRVTATVGTAPVAGLGRDALLDFRMVVSLDGETLSEAEVEALLAGTEGLALVRGRWVEVDPERLGRAMDRYREAERLAREGGLGFGEAMRLLAGADVSAGAEEREADPRWSGVVAGPWLAETLAGLRSPEGLARVDPGPELRGTLRPYQTVGLRWLHLLCRLGLGACLADDMGLGKTVQVLALLLVERREAGRERRPSLLVAPASLLANWASEIERFAPGLEALVAHPSAMPSTELAALEPGRLAGQDLVITSYGTLLRAPWLSETSWDLVVLDEAQAIKNPGAKQTRAAKKLEARARIALTGTPVENRLSDLWSIFDFLNPGLLGSAKAFGAYTKGLAGRRGNAYGPLRDLVRPYVLRRLKTDRSVISDLPDKTEVKAYCGLSRRQAALYQQAVDELEEGLGQADGMARRGLVLAALMRLKQICNHPSQWLGDGRWAEKESGKLERLRELGETIAARQEKVLVFTQFREVTEPLAAFLGGLFGGPGLVLHGGTPVRRRKELVQRFQEDESVPFFVLSLKAGGSGLNLTAASHVVHFDRWWNPAVEDQATDRAFRIGQTRNVLVHKLLCRGTVEERIDQMIEAKKQVARDLLEGGRELDLTELTDEELLGLVALDLRAATKE